MCRVPVRTRHPLIWPRRCRPRLTPFRAKRQKRLDQRQNPVAVEEFEYKVRRIISDYLTPPKNAYKLNRVLWWMARFRQETSMKWCLCATNMICSRPMKLKISSSALSLSATASLERTESRWLPWHFRSDFPEKDDANWRKRIVLKKGVSGVDKIDISHKEIIKMKDKGGAACA